MTDLAAKLARLESTLRAMDSVLVAYSGGVDSTFLAVVANEVLGKRTLAVTAVSPSLAPAELDEAVALAKQFRLSHRLVHTQEVEDPRYAANDARRCYFCKVELYSHLKRLANDEGYAWIASGTNVDDLRDFRPGLKAGAENDIRNPLVEAGLTKADVRQLSRERGLPTWDKPAQACLSSRIPYGAPVTVEALTRIAQAEAHLKEMGFRQVRVRHHDTVARIEVGQEDLPRLVQDHIRRAIVARLRQVGYLHVTLDLEGYQAGGLNVALRQRAAKTRRP